MSDDPFLDVGAAAAAAAGGETDEDTGLSIIPNSACIQCHGSGVTRMLTTRVPYFREIIVCSFECDDTENCGFTNNEVTFGGELQPKGVHFELEVDGLRELRHGFEGVYCGGTKAGRCPREAMGWAQRV